MTGSAVLERAATRFSDVPTEIDGDLRMTRRYYLRHSAQGLISGTVFHVTFPVAAVPSAVWPVFRDLNAWHGKVNHYSGIAGDLEGRSMHLSSSSEPGAWRVTYNVVRVIPEHLIVLSGPLAYAAPPAERRQRLGGMNVFMLAPIAGNTDVSCFLEQAWIDRSSNDEGQQLAAWNAQGPASHAKWRDHFVPTLRRLVRDRVGRT